MKIILIISSVIFILGCGDNNQVSQKGLTPELDSTDYEIISSATNEYIFTPKGLIQNRKYDYDTIKNRFDKVSIWTGDTSKNRIYPGFIVLLDSTEFYPSKRYITDVTKLLDTNDKHLPNRLKVENRVKYHLDSSRLKFSFKVKVLPRNSVKFADSSYSVSHGTIHVSKPSYSENKTKAVIYISEFDWDIILNYLIWLIKDNGKWTAYDINDYYY